MSFDPIRYNSDALWRSFLKIWAKIARYPYMANGLTTLAVVHV
jgi:hypothetical protein